MSFVLFFLLQVSLLKITTSTYDYKNLIATIASNKLIKTKFPRKTSKKLNTQA